MLQAYRLQSKSKHSPFRSYTLFGALCWAYRMKNDEEALVRFLEKFIENPTFRISSPMPVYKDIPFVPKPIFNYGNSDAEDMKVVAKRKKLKKVKWLSINAYKQVSEDIKKGSFQELYLIDKDSKYKQVGENSPFVILKSEQINDMISIKPLSDTHNSLDPITMESKGLFIEDSLILQNLDYYILVKFEDESFANEFSELLGIVEANGIGKNKNVGWGYFELKQAPKIAKQFEPLYGKKGGYVSLAPVLPFDGLNLGKSYYNIEPFLAYPETGLQGDRVVKKPFIYFVEGSFFQEDNKRSLYLEPAYKPAYKGVDRTIYQYGLEFPIQFGGEQ